MIIFLFLPLGLVCLLIFGLICLERRVAKRNKRRRKIRENYFKQINLNYWEQYKKSTMKTLLEFYGSN